jgi:aldehyde:ferredoxin oxidoreductase
VKFKGYAGLFLHVNLTTGKLKKVPLDEKLALEYLGGAGFCSRILYDRIKPGTDPLSPENVLMFATGPLTGTLFPQASRYVVAAKSPLTEIWGESHAAGHWGPELKYAGYDAIVVEGRSAKPVYLRIDDDAVELKEAGDLWGKTTHETDDILRKDMGDPYVKVASIGPAGENLVRYAAIMNDRERCAARSGLGAVMGSKKLKAIVVRGSKDIEVAEADKYLEFIDELQKRMLAHPFTEGRVKYGTTYLIELMQEIGRLPTYNMRQGVFEEYEKISGETIRKKYLVKPRACFSCVQRCGRYTKVDKGPFAFIGGSPEFETQSSLGSRCGVSNVEAVLFAHYLCNAYGMDGISTGATISWAMECYDVGILTKKDTGGIDLSWGNYETLIQLITMIAKRKGFGDLLAEGSYRAARKIGRGSEKYVMHVKKQEIAAQEPRAQKSMGLAAVTAARGADHLYAFPVLDEVSFKDTIEERFGKEYLPEIADRLNPKYKGLMVKECEDYMVVVESVGVCKYGTQIPPVYYYDDISKALKLTCGMNVSEERLRLIGERIVNLNRAFNAREGISRKDDILPERLTKEPSPKGPAKGQVVELEEMLREYYTLRGWNIESGLPAKQKLLELGLGEVAEELEEKLLQVTSPTPRKKPPGYG